MDDSNSHANAVERLAPKESVPAVSAGIVMPHGAENRKVCRLSQPTFSETDPAETAGTLSFKPLDKAAPITKTRRFLPHWTQAGCTYFVTFRLADSVAAPVWRQWKEQRGAYRDAHPEPWDDVTRKEYHALFTAKMERWLGCRLWLVRAARSGAAGPHGYDNASLRHYDGQHFTLGDFVLMPNHVHVLVTPHDGHLLDDILTGWRRVSGHGILRRTGRPKPFWMDEHFDHAVRSVRQLQHYRNYISENPQKAFLKPGTWTHWRRDGWMEPEEKDRNVCLLSQQAEECTAEATLIDADSEDRR